MVDTVIVVLNRLSRPIIYFYINLYCKNGFSHCSGHFFPDGPIHYYESPLYYIKRAISKQLCPSLYIAHDERLLGLNLHEDLMSHEPQCSRFTTHHNLLNAFYIYIKWLKPFAPLYRFFIGKQDQCS